MTDAKGFAHADVRSRWLALAVVVLTMTEKLRPIGFGEHLLALIGLVGLLCFNDGHATSFGFTLRPVQGWVYWCRMALWFALLIGLLIALCGGVWLTCGWTFPTLPHIYPSLAALIFFCVNAPVTEEVIFRILLTVAICPTVGGRGTILVGGIVFALAHVLNGNPSPDNQIAGFMLGWAFLKSRSILVPLAMHSGGNLIAFSFHIGSWYFS